MGAFSIWHWLIVLAVVLLLFGGRGKISGLMGDLGKGLKAFKSNLKDDKTGEASEAAPSQVEHKTTEAETLEPVKSEQAEGSSDKQNS